MFTDTNFEDCDNINNLDLGNACNKTTQISMLMIVKFSKKKRFFIIRTGKKHSDYTWHLRHHFK